MPNAPKILIIGGGISGLACAWRLRQLGLPVLLLERGSRFGGVIETVEQDGFRFDVGPQSFTNTPALSELIDEVDLDGELLRADARAPRYILHGGRLVPAPFSPPRLLTTPLVAFALSCEFSPNPFFARTLPTRTNRSPHSCGENSERTCSPTWWAHLSPESGPAIRKSSASPPRFPPCV